MSSACGFMRIVNAGDAGSGKLGDHTMFQASKGTGNGRRLINLNPWYSASPGKH